MSCTASTQRAPVAISAASCVETSGRAQANQRPYGSTAKAAPAASPSVARVRGAVPRVPVWV